MYDVSKPFSLPPSLALPLRGFARSFFLVDRSLSLGLSFCGLPRFLIGQRNFLPSTHRRNSSIAPTPTCITKLFSPRLSFLSSASGLLKPRAIPIWDHGAVKIRPTATSRWNEAPRSSVFKRSGTTFSSFPAIGTESPTISQTDSDSRLIVASNIRGQHRTPPAKISICRLNAVRKKRATHGTTFTLWNYENRQATDSF